VVNLAGIPAELILKILSLLSLNDLASAVFVCKVISSVAIDEYEQRQVRQYQQDLADTELWSNLVFIAQPDAVKVGDQRFINYLETITGSIPFQERLWTRTYSKFSQNVTRISWISQLPPSFIETVSSAQVIAEQLIGKAPHVSATDEASAKPPQALIEFMKVNKGEFSNLYLWESYSKLHKMMLSFALAYQLSRPSNEIEKIHIITKPVYSYLLDREMILFFDKICLPHLILSMIEEAVRLYKLPNPQPAQKQKLLDVENTLEKLTEDDLASYFIHCFKNDDSNDTLINKFTRILEQDYPFLMSRLTEKLVLAITKIHDDLSCYFRSEDAPCLAGILISKQEILNRLSQKGFVTLLKRLPLRDIPEVLASPIVAPRLTFPTLSQWLDRSRDVSFITHEDDGHFKHRAIQILTNDDLLKRLTKDEIVFIAGFLITQGVKEVANNPNFITRVLQEQHPVSLLMALCNMKFGFFLKAIVQHTQLIKLFSVENLMALALKHTEALVLFLENKDVINRFSDKQLWELVKKGGGIVLSAVVKHSLYDRFSDAQLQEFAEKWSSSDKLTATEQKTLCYANWRRNRPGLMKDLERLKSGAPETEQTTQPDVDAKAAKKLEQTNDYNHPEPKVSVKQIPIEFTKSKPFAIPNAKAHQSSTSKKKKSRKKQNRLILQIIFYTVLTLVGLALIASGIGGIAGVPLFAKMSALLVSVTPLHLAISALVLGVALAGTSIFQVIGRAIQYHTLEKNNSHKPSPYQSLPRRLPLQALVQTEKQNDTGKNNIYQFSKQSPLRSLSALNERPSAKDSNHSPDEMQSISSGVTLPHQ
jgi:hypothetical protein